MAKKIDLFYILKINVSAILENNSKISTTFENAKRQGWVVTIGDNQVLKFIRDIKCIDFDKQRLKIAELYKVRNILKSKPKSLENSLQISEYQKQIDDILYIPDVVSVHADTTKKDYNKVTKNKFVINGVTYKRLCAGAGQLRRNTVLFVVENLHSQLEKIMYCGLDSKRIGKINLAKFSAYFSLYSSSTNLVSTPRVCVVKDYDLELTNQKIDWIYQKEDGERDIEHRTMDVVQNVWDGSGIISKEMAEKWNEDLGITEYSPSAYIIRTAWVKGLCIVFDWKRFAKDVAKKEYITDAWGHEKYIKDIDVILTTSQFKMWKKYSSWEEYIEFHTEHKHVWGCSRVNKEKDNYLTTLNYQYIQSNFFSSESIKKLADFSIDWVKKVCTYERIYVLLFLLGYHESDKKLSKVEQSASMDIAKALMYNEEILNDTYVKSRIYKSIQNKINQIKIGKPLVEGAYEFAIVDPYMLCEYIFGLTPVGLLKENQLWNHRWVSKGSKEVAVMRSPLVSPHENQVMQVYSDKKCNDWFSTVPSGVILNAWDTALMRASDADCDGDLLLTSDNEYLVSSIDRSLNTLTYEKSTTKEQNISYSNLAKMDTKSFNTKIGFITNLATSFMCLREQYTVGSKEYVELTKRINLLRFHQGSAIDAGKGNLYIPTPKHWSKREKINYEIDSEEEKQRKYFINKLVGDKKSYFMVYIYPALMKAYTQHIGSSKRICRAMFGCRLDAILKSNNRNDRERKFVKNYYRYLPVSTNKSIMNELCRYVEDIDFCIKYIKNENAFDYTVLMNKDLIINRNSLVYKKIFSVLKKYHSIYELNTHERKYIEEDYENESDSDQDEKEKFSILFGEIEKELFKVCSNKSELCNNVVHIMYNDFKSKSKAIMWNICGNELVLNLKSKSNKAYFPVEANDDTGVEYLGKYYKLQEVEIDNI